MFRKIWKPKFEQHIDENERQERRDASGALGMSGSLVSAASLIVWSAQNESTTPNVFLEHYSAIGIFAGGVMLVGSAVGFGVEFLRERNLTKNAAGYKFPENPAQFSKRWDEIVDTNPELAVAFACRIENSVAFMVLPEDLE